MRERLADLAALLLGYAIGTILPPVAQRITVKAIVLFAVLAVLAHLCGRRLRLLLPRLPIPGLVAVLAPGIRRPRRGPTPAERRHRAWLARTRPPHTGPPRPGRRPDHPDGLPQDTAAPP